MPGRPSCLRDSGDHRHCAVGGDGEDAVDADPARDLDDRVHLHEVDDLGDVGGGEPGRVGIPVDSGDAKAARARLLDRSLLMAPCADEEDGLHGRRC